jgi:CspA family cold shock protein
MSHRGQVKWFDPKKGYGFIVGPDGHDVFVHYSQIDQEGFRLLKDGEEVDYELVESDKGYQARQVQRLSVEVNPDAVSGMVSRGAPGERTGRS